MPDRRAGEEAKREGPGCPDARGKSSCAKQDV